MYIMRRKDNASTTSRPAMNQAISPLKPISPQSLVCMDSFVSKHPMVVDLAYAREDNFLFGERIYRQGAQLWLHEDLANVVLDAAKRVHRAMGGRLVLYDGLRVKDAQSAMLKTKRVRDNPQWLEEPRLLSPPGAGGHPRGMAVDVSIIDADEKLLDMGTPFDFLSDDPCPSVNAAHREHAHPRDILNNRAILNDAMMGAAKHLDVALLPLPQEWWDYRLPHAVYESYAPLSDKDLPAHMRLMG